jgi:hypothetical protein
MNLNDDTHLFVSNYDKRHPQNINRSDSSVFIVWFTVMHQ